MNPRVVLWLWLAACYGPSVRPATGNALTGPSYVGLVPGLAIGIAASHSGTASAA